ncbi:DUF305 domain-containing protein [Dactylosporangium sp. AC04546]|uniref:DUF305 domain-containing protein n=1 Tax=Dactylosporangium sp. AC04546 TaxID=2862460 RepID=UPI001EDF5ED0|nr:DUF305 domain-containing protein [Dactylosporangium sp. AC04546]WVK79307.1 DUF305 domain-containing protein [Dactylosporangium sp. AC04546]
MHSHHLRAAAVSVALFAITAGISACGGGTHHDPGARPTSPAVAASGTVAGGFNGIDVRFATDMIPHHRQALEMAKLAEARAATPAVKDLAGRISKAQEPEIATMSGWLTAWGEPVPSPGGMEHGTDHDAMGGMPGMMSQQEMQQLAKATGTEFDRLFLTMMIRHHEGAVEMAKAEQAQGANPAAKQLAGDIAAGQTAEIAEMERLLGKL